MNNFIKILYKISKARIDIVITPKIYIVISCCNIILIIKSNPKNIISAN